MQKSELVYFRILVVVVEIKKKRKKMRKTISFPSCGATSCRTLVAGKQPTPPHAFARGERTIPLPGSSWVHCLTAALAPPPRPPPSTTATKRTA